MESNPSRSSLTVGIVSAAAIIGISLRVRALDLGIVAVDGTLPRTAIGTFRGVSKVIKLNHNQHTEPCRVPSRA